MEPVENIGKQDIYSLLLDIKQTNATLGGELAKTIDHKMDEVKNELCNDLKDMKVNIDKNTGDIVNLEHSQTQQKIFLCTKYHELRHSIYTKRVGKNNTYLHNIHNIHNIHT